MVLIPAGEFLMGSDPSVDQDAYDDEQPQHTLHLPDYYLAKTPVTNAQYVAFAGYGPRPAETLEKREETTKRRRGSSRGLGHLA
jgi:formylglycine-generating enzyme required for sulfatase activity